MRALTLWRPWTWAIYHAGPRRKLIENRDWEPPRSVMGQIIALHAGKTFDREHTAGKSSAVERRPLVNANRAQRLNSIPHLGRLVNELVASAEREIAEVAAATKKVHEFTAAFEGEKP